jgi:adenylate kinase
MAPITDEAVSELKDLVARLEKRVHELEAKAGISTPRSAAQRMRMVLMGPPGAGKLCSVPILSFSKAIMSNQLDQ